MAETARMAPQRIKVSSKRQITIPAKAYKDMGFTEYALIEQTEEGLLIKPLKVEDEITPLSVLRDLVEGGYEGEELLARYAEVYPGACEVRDVRSAGGPSRYRLKADGENSEEREHVLAAVKAECALYPAIVRAFVFGSFARGDFVEKSDVDVRIEYDKASPFSLFEVAQLQKHIERVVGRSVDVVTAKGLKNSNLAEAIERDKVLVYERDGI